MLTYKATLKNMIKVAKSSITNIGCARVKISLCSFLLAAAEVLRSFRGWDMLENGAPIVHQISNVGITLVHKRDNCLAISS